MNGELLEYFERSDERFLLHCKDMNDTLMKKMDADSTAMLWTHGVYGHGDGETIPLMTATESKKQCCTLYCSHFNI